jgi:molybdopterin-guanine dinucleotide biosynthesis protein A
MRIGAGSTALLARAAMDERPVLGILVGGASRRMGGQAKGLLATPGESETLIERAVRVGHDAGLEPVLVGDASAYEALCPDARRIADEPPESGPLGGLAALLSYAGGRDAILIGCDMPNVDAGVLRRLVDHPGSAPVLAARRDGRLEPLLARYRASAAVALATAFAAGVRSFQELFALLDVDELAVDEAISRALVDWDAPEDIEP